tara:strand:+ start:808 stop:1626 length:819 start_codon:yes stop_codon:yes gene_type:complete
MKILRNKINLKKEILDIKGLAFIPTMGALHYGHVKMIKFAKNKFKKIIVSIFVNPKQFNSKHDFKSYPRNIEKDIKLLKRLKVDFLYLPSYIDIFSFKTKKKVYLHSFSKKLCGKYRKGHFEGVLNVVNRFLEIIKPRYIVLGKKDFQQLFLIKQHIQKSKIHTKVISYKTIREKNGVALSSRNFKLNSKQIKVCSLIVNYLKKEKRKIKEKKFFFDLKDLLLKKIKKFNTVKIDYLDFLNLKTLKKPKSRKNSFNIFIAYRINNIRLIDNF